jgi:hypothetical protein
MTYRLKYLYLALLLLLGAGLSACRDSSAQTGDISPFPGDVVAQATSPATAAPADPEADVPPAPEPAQAADGPILTFTISGGPVGFCDELTVMPDGEYRLRLCDETEITGELSQSDRVSLLAWHQNLADINLAFEDNAGEADPLKAALTFEGQGEVEADERQQQIIYDWVNGLAIRLRPQPLEPTPTPQPVVTGPEGICPGVTRPALLTLNFETPTTLVLVDPGTATTCDIPLNQLPAGRLAAVAGRLFYPVFDPAAKTLTIWQLTPTGEHLPLSFTSLPAEEPAPFDFVISGDGRQIAWSQTSIDLEAEPPLYRNNLWLAQVDGSNQIAVLDNVENNEQRFVAPVRFSNDGTSFYYALQPDMGGSFNGRYDNLYEVPLAGGTPELIYACPTAENPACLGGISPDGAFFTVIQQAEGTLQVLDRNSSLVNSFPLPATDYVERTAFSPSGNLAFMAATLTEGTEEAPPRPNPGNISVIAAPYTGSLQTLLADNRVGALMGWLDENRLVFGLIDETGKPATALLTLDGQVSEVSPDIAVAVWQ